MTPVRSASPRPGVLVVTIDRPSARNAIDDAVANGVAEVMERADADDGCRAIVLTGAGGGFSAGLDLKAFLDGQLGEHPDRGFAGLVRRPPDTPILAAIEGYALAGGLEVALACDLVVAASDARIGIPEVTRGLAADGGALLRLPDLVGRNVAMEMALTGGEVPVERLHQLGLVNVVAQPGAALDTALDIAEVIASNGPLGVLASKRVLREARQWPPAEVWERQAEVLSHVWTSADAREGARAFTEKRPPRYRGE